MAVTDVISIFLALIAAIGTIGGPALGYMIARRKVGGEVLLADIEAVKGWSEQRKAYEAEIADLHDLINEERDRRREDKENHFKEMEELRGEIGLLREKLQDCTGD